MRVSDVWYYPFSFIVSSIAWWGVIARLAIRLHKKKTSANHGLESTGAPPAAGTPETHP